MDIGKELQSKILQSCIKMTAVKFGFNFNVFCVLLIFYLNLSLQCAIIMIKTFDINNNKTDKLFSPIMQSNNSHRLKKI